jgi:hypothetical protein
MVLASRKKSLPSSLRLMLQSMVLEFVTHLSVRRRALACLVPIRQYKRTLKPRSVKKITRLKGLLRSSVNCLISHRSPSTVLISGRNRLGSHLTDQFLSGIPSLVTHSNAEHLEILRLSYLTTLEQHNFELRNHLQPAVSLRFPISLHQQLIYTISNPMEGPRYCLSLHLINLPAHFRPVIH